MVTFREVLESNGWEQDGATPSMAIYRGDQDAGRILLALSCAGGRAGPRWRHSVDGAVWKQGSTVDDLAQYLTRLARPGHTFQNGGKGVLGP